MFFHLFLIGSCGPPDKPVDFNAGEHQCSHCKMGINDMRFKAEAITQKGKIYRFDSIECLASWSMENEQTIPLSSAWVGNFLKQGEWIDVNKAIFLYSQKLHSPMGAGLSAYKLESEFNEAQKIYGGDKMDYSALKVFIARNQKISSNSEINSASTVHGHN